MSTLAEYQQQLQNDEGFERYELVGHIPRGLRNIEHQQYCLEETGMRGFPKKRKKCGNGLKVSCKYIVKGPKYMLTNIECMIKDYLG